jgi:hypothetical protein
MIFYYVYEFLAFARSAATISRRYTFSPFIKDEIMVENGRNKIQP